MLKFLIILAILFQSEANAQSVNHSARGQENFDATIDRKYIPGKCYLSQLFNFIIVGKTDEHIYEINGYTYPNSFPGFIQTKNLKADSAGQKLMFVLMEHVGVREFPLENGFTGKFDLWRECSAEMLPDGTIFSEPYKSWETDK